MRRGALSTVAFVVVAAGCTSSSTGGGAGNDAAQAPPKGFLSAPDCVACLDTSCSIELRACNADVECRSLLDCRSRAVTAAEDDACLARFGADSGPGATVGALAECSLWRCAMDCPPPAVRDEDVSTCGARAAAAYPAVEAACGARLDCACQGCSAQVLACLDHAPCTALMECVEMTGCRGTDCFAACKPVADAVGGWYDLTFALRGCLDNRCDSCSVLDAGGP